MCGAQMQSRCMTETCAIHTAGLADVGQIMPVMATAFDPMFREAWTQSQVESALLIPGTKLFVATRNDCPVGFALVRSLFEECELLLIAVLPAMREQRIGSALIQYTLAVAKVSSVLKLFLEVRITNGAISFYHRHGFKVIGERPNYYRNKCGEPLNALTMTVDI